MHLHKAEFPRSSQQLGVLRGPAPGSWWLREQREGEGDTLAAGTGGRTTAAQPPRPRGHTRPSPRV